MDLLLHAHPVAWLALIPAWAFFLRLLAGLFQADIPSWPRAVTNVILTGAAAFLAYDGAGFAFLHMFGTKYVEIPANYGYGNWILESPLLKWEVLGLVPAIRYIPVVVALCVGGTLEVLILVIPFRIGTLLFVVHWAANLGVLALVGLLQTVALPEQSASWGFRAPAQSGLRLKAHPDLSPETLKGILAGMVPKTDFDPAKKLPGKPAETEKKKKDAVPPSPSPPPQDASIGDVVQTLLNDMEPQLDSVKEASAPVLSRYPQVEAYLNDGGWWHVLLILALLSICWILMAIARIQRLTAPPDR